MDSADTDAFIWLIYNVIHNTITPGTLSVHVSIYIYELHIGCSNLILYTIIIYGDSTHLLIFYIIGVIIHGFYMQMEITEKQKLISLFLVLRSNLLNSSSSLSLSIH